MSHVVSIKTQLRDQTAIQAACRRLGLSEPVKGKARMYDGQTVEGLLVQLPGWKYPLAIDTQSGELKHDNFQGHWGDQSRLDAFFQAYSVEAVRIEARRKGYPITETTLANGYILLQVQEGHEPTQPSHHPPCHSFCCHPAKQPPAPETANQA